MPLVVWLCLAQGPSAGQLLITDVQAAYGYFDPVRPRLEYCAPQDLICFRFTLHGIGLRDHARTDVRVEGRLLDAKGHTAALASGVEAMPVVLGGDRVPGLVELPLTAPLPPGPYTFRATVTDNTSGATASFERTVTVTPVRLSVRRARCYLDPNRLVAVNPTRAQVGQVLFFAYELILPDPGGDELEVTLKSRILDADTRQPIGPECKADVHGPNPHVPVAPASFHGPLGPMTRPGRFIIQATFHDLISGAKLTFETPLIVGE